MNKAWHQIGLVLSVVALLMTVAACGGNETVTERQTSFKEPPKIEIDASKTYEADIETNKGKFTIELFAKDAPVTVNSFVFLARHRYYEGIVFHRIVPDYIIQTGDPTGTGRGGPGYTFEDELSSTYKYETGIVAMANAGPDTNGSQFFICTGQQSEYLNQIPNYTIFGRVKEGMETVQAINSTPVNGKKPLEDITIQKISIIEK